ncbi:conserved hypothetical protein [Ricinus communis]|uniref:HTH tetR-type domain-containing protein n=1 Tax=Ricinus communis TaxID=3988 RepID=B9TLE5_RICCO|nr:conserved hypothetical protein [Ricinus communis]
MAPTYSVRNSSRDALLDALETLLTEGSVHDVTLDGVAALAGITKSGLIYHFKSKEALLSALVERMRANMDVCCFDDHADPRQALKTFLLGRIRFAFGISDQKKKLMANLLAAASSYPAVLKPVRRMYEAGTTDLARVADSAGIGLTVWTTLDGLVLLEMLNLRHFSDAEKQQMQATLVAMVEQHFADTSA